MEKSNYFPGSVKIRISGSNIERFLNIAVQRGLHLREISCDAEGYITFWAQVKELKELNKIRRKTDVRLRMGKRYGFLFLMEKSKGRKLMITGFLAFFFLLIQWSFFIWDITIEGNLKFSDQTLLNFMESINVQNGIKKTDVSCDAIEKELRNQFREITWVSAEIRGTRLVVSIRENDALLAEIRPNKMPCHMVAAKDGVIVQSVVRSGLPVVKAGDRVAAGQIIVDGLLPVLDDSGNQVKINAVHADGEIYANTIEPVSFHMPLICKEKIRTGIQRNGFLLGDMDQLFYFMLPARSGTQWEYVTEQKQMKLFGNYYLPIYFGRVAAYEVSCYDRKILKIEAEKHLEIYLAEYMEKLAEKGVQILGCDGRIEQDESGWHYEGTLRLLENIAVEVAIPENQKENHIVNECN